MYEDEFLEEQYEDLFLTDADLNVDDFDEYEYEDEEY